MFENTPLPGGLQSNPLNPPMTSPGLPTSGSVPAPAPMPTGVPQPQVHTMPERFRTAGGGSSNLGGGPPSSKSTKKLVIILIVVLVVAGLGVAGLFVFQRVNNTNNANTTNVSANRNTNVNTTNENVNAVSNQNVNAVNENTNTVNTNTETNTNTQVNTNTVANTNTTTTIGAPLPSSNDADTDGLTDVEEGVYGTDSAKPDSDNDTFIDGKQVRPDGTVIGEVYNGFNPAGEGKLEGSALVRRQENANQEYNVLVPSQWTATTDSSGGMLIVPSQATGESIQFRINENPNRLSPKEWYKSISPNSDTDSMTIISVNGLEALYTEDQSTIYFFKDTKVYSLQYQTGSLSQVNFRTTIDMMVRSFTLGAAS